MAAPDKTIDLQYLQREAVNYQADLMMYPYLIMREELGRMGIRLMQTAKTDKIISFERKGGMLRPYVAGNDPDYADLGRFKEMKLELETGYAAMKEHTKNYRDKNVLNTLMIGTAYNQTKKHPQESLFTGQSVVTFSEDVLECSFGGVRNELDLTPQGAFDGYDTKIDAFVVDGDIAEANGNLIPTGDIAAPADETDYTAIDKIVAFVRGAHRNLRTKPALLYLTQAVYQHAYDALENKYKYKDITLAAIETYINQKANSKVIVTVSPLLGQGNRITLTAIGNYDFGMDTMSDMTFVQVRNPWEDPNLVQFWLQAEFGTRIRTVHPKMFAINDGSPDHTEINLSGDYKS